MKDLFIDIETYSNTPIDNGVYEYAADPDFQVLLFGYSIDKEPVKVVDLAEGEKLSDELTAALTDPKVLKHAHNAAFERVCLSRFLGMPVGTYLDPAQWRCTMVKCAYYGLPLKLENAGIALKIDRKKFADTGKKLIKKFCVPSHDGRPECYPEENPIEWETFKEYNIRDVEAEIDIDNALPDIRYEKLWDEYAADQRINDNGALIDRVLVDNIVHINEEIDAEHLRRFKELTYIDNPKSVTQLKAWFAAKGYSMTSLDKKTVSDLSKTCKDPEVLEVLKLRQLTGKSSIAKYTAMQNLIANAPDHRARGCFQFYGSHTGRWCLTGDHEVLTLKGWVRLDEWWGGEIAVYNPSLETVSFQKSKALVFDYEGIMYEYDDKRCAQKSTPDHKMLYKPRYDKPWTTGTVEEMAKLRPIIPFTGSRIMSSNLDHSMLRVLIMTQADGCFAVDGTVKYGFTKLRKVERCKKLLREAGLLFSYTIYENNPKTRHQIDIAARNVPLWLRLFQNKTFDTWLFNESPDVFFEELQYWDGSRSAANSIQYVTCNKQNADIVQAFAHITGRACSVRVKDRRAEHPNWSVAYVVDIWLTPKNAHELKDKPTQEYYCGKVYCAETSTGFFLVRRKGRVWVTGNSGRHIQLQNLPQNHMAELDSARQLVREGDEETLELLYDNLPQVFSELIRTAIIAPEGKTLIVADFSAIEARVIAWVAGEKWKLQAFKDGKDLYCSTASAMFGVPVEKHGVNGDLRQKGKIAELACIAEGSPVLTDKGLVPIEQVTTDMKLWDGEEWVEHEGVIDKGIREVITYEGLTATIDHLVWAEGKERPIYFGTAAALGLHLVQTGNSGKALRVGGDHWSGETMEQTQKSLLCSDTMHGMWCSPVADTGSSDKRKIERLSSMFAAETGPGMAIQETDSSEAKMRKPERQRLQKLRSKRYKVRLFKRDRSRAVSDKDLRATRQGFGNRQDRHQQGLHYRKPEICYAYHKLRKSTEMCAHKVRSEILALWTHNYDQKTLSGYDKSRSNSGCGEGSTRETEKLAFDIRQAKVYDIRNAGRHHRFTVSDHLVHNCGYGGSVGALKAFGAVEMGIPESELDNIVRSWREANPNIVKLWWNVGNAAIDLIEGKAKVRHVNAQIGMSFQKGNLLIRLPSDRLLVYPNAGIGENRFGGKSIVYEGVNSTTHQWDYIDTYGPRLVENIIQAIARDLLTEAILRIAKNPDCKIVAHVHDEIIIEADPDKVTLDDMIEAMCVLPDWGDGLILNAAGFTSPYYMKD